MFQLPRKKNNNNNNNLNINLIRLVSILSTTAALILSGATIVSSASLHSGEATSSSSSSSSSSKTSILSSSSSPPKVVLNEPLSLQQSQTVAVLAASVPKVKRDSSRATTKVSSTNGGAALDQLDTQETGYLAPAYQTADSGYGYDAGKNSYGKQASDWSLYDQGNHGLYDKYGDKGWQDQGQNSHSSHGKHDSYGNSYNSHGSGHGSGYYSRDRGYGYEKHYAYDKEVASKQHADNHNSYGSAQGLHDHYGNQGSQSHSNHGHDKYGQLSRYGNHGYGKRGSNYAANHDYGHNQNKGHYYTQSAPPPPPPPAQHVYSPSSYSAHVPTYRSTYSDYSPQIGYPSSYPSYY